MKLNHKTHSFYEFFAGGGMARAGLGVSWQCLFANDFDPVKAASYAVNWGADHLHVADVAEVSARVLPGRVDLAWASFPCQDLSLAGDGRGLGNDTLTNPTRSGAFWPFWRLMRRLKLERRQPSIVVLENVCGVLTSRKGQDFTAICDAIATENYRFGAVALDARHFVPQSRKRIFVIGIHEDFEADLGFLSGEVQNRIHPEALLRAYHRLSSPAKTRWVWWNLPEPKRRNHDLAQVLEIEPRGVAWHTKAETDYLVSMMSLANLKKIEEVQDGGGNAVGTIYRRTRVERDGVRRQRAEVRFDKTAGCLRTPGGGSSRQIILTVEARQLRSRLLSPREGARLMGLPDQYKLPDHYNDAYRLIGDGVCVPVVRHLAEHIIEPLLRNNDAAFRQQAA